MDSIIKKSKSCFFCGDTRNIEKHHALHGTANRRLADKDGLWVWVCPECHRGTNGVHGKNGHGKDLTLKMTAEYAWMKHYGKTEYDFVQRYGKNYL